jgi:hypothetical protein
MEIECKAKRMRGVGEVHLTTMGQNVAGQKDVAFIKEVTNGLSHFNLSYNKASFKV